MSKEVSIPPEVIEKIKDQLEPDEKQIWFGMPRTSFLTPRAFIPMMMGLVFCSMVITMIATMSFSCPGGIGGIVILMTLFGALFFGGSGLFLLYIPRMQYKADKKTAYLITDRRAIVFKGGVLKATDVYTPDKLGNIYRKENRRGYGSVLIPLARDAIKDFEVMYRERGFLKIENVHEVERLLRQLSRQAGSDTA
jgi:hypothetical protein